jgi:hypothetical protein
MADSTGTVPKPSSSVKLVLLGEAAVGKVSTLRCPVSHSDFCHRSYVSEMMTLKVILVLAGNALRQQRLPRE